MASGDPFPFPPDAGTDGETVMASTDRTSVDPPGAPSPYSCPDCGGVLWIVPAANEHFRCRVGHRFTQESLDGEQDAVIEDALWTALRALEEQASLAERVASRAIDRGDLAFADRFRERRDDAVQRAARIRRTLRSVVPDGVPSTRSNGSRETGSSAAAVQDAPPRPATVDMQP